MNAQVAMSAEPVVLDAVTVPTVRQAQQRISELVRRTPLVQSVPLSKLTGGEVWLKLECQQPTGSFKVRGATNRVSLLTPEQRARGVVTGSAGNHGLGVAYAARAQGGMSADIFVPLTASCPKVRKLEDLGVRVHQQGHTYEDAHQAAEAFSRETGATYVQAYNDVDVIAGQGTVALEVLEDLPEIDMALVPVGGGGLIAGVATVLKSEKPGCRIVGLQPEASPAALLSLRDSRAYDPFDHSPTLADGLAGGFGVIPFAIAGNLIDQVLLSSEQDLRQAIFWLLDQEQLVVEASGAISIAPLLNGSLNVSEKTVVCILTGANIETAVLRDILTEFTA